MPDNTFADIDLSVSEFVALLNQTLEFAYPSVTIVGELSNFRVSKNQWVYFDLKDESSSVKFFGTVYSLPGPLEEGMLVRVTGQPRLHNLYGFSVTFQLIRPAGEGSLKRAAELLKLKLAGEGLFDESRKRQLPYPPDVIGLITSKQSAAYADFIKILDARWQGVAIQCVDVQVQGDAAPSQIVNAILKLNARAEPPEVIAIIRGGGSADDLAAFSSEHVVRAVAASRVPTLVAIGHEVDVSLAELAADRRASTPSNAAELLTPDKTQVLREIRTIERTLKQSLVAVLRTAENEVKQYRRVMIESIDDLLIVAQRLLANRRQMLEVLSPEAVLKRGYAIVRNNKRIIRSAGQAHSGDIVDITLRDGGFSATVNNGNN